MTKAVLDSSELFLLRKHSPMLSDLRRLCLGARSGFLVSLLSLLFAGGLQAETRAQANTRAGSDESGPTASSFRFVFGDAPIRRGVIRVSPETVYTPQLGYGLISPAHLHATPSSLCGDHEPFVFTLDLPEGNYDVSLTLGDSQGESLTTVKAEARRLLLEEVRTVQGKLAVRRFTVNVRYKELATGETVHLKNDEQNEFDWDHRLTLEFNNTHACVASLEIHRNTRAVTIYIAGDSTVTDQRREPWAAWGQMLPRFFVPGVAIANHAESGETLKSFIGERRLAKLIETIKPGDYLFIQFAHNDQKPGPSHLDAFTTYKEYLKLYIDEARKRKAVPVLVTSMHRRRFDSEGKIVNTLEDYPEAMRQIAKEQHVALIDLNAMSKALFEALGPKGTLKAFVHYPPGTFAGQTQELKDDTHFNSYGAYELARCVVEGIKASNLGIAKYLIPNVERFDPSRPDSVEAWKLPASPWMSDQKPEGN